MSTVILAISFLIVVIILGIWSITSENIRERKTSNEKKKIMVS